MDTYATPAQLRDAIAHVDAVLTRTPRDSEFWADLCTGSRALKTQLRTVETR